MERPIDTVTHAILEVEWLKSMQMVNNECQNQEGAEYLRRYDRIIKLLHIGRNDLGYITASGLLEKYFSLPVNCHVTAVMCTWLSSSPGVLTRQRDCLTSRRSTRNCCTHCLQTSSGVIDVDWTPAHVSCVDLCLIPPCSSSLCKHCQRVNYQTFISFSS